LIILFAYLTHEDTFSISSLFAHVRKDTSQSLGRINASC
jgi:hypothetical protein